MNKYIQVSLSGDKDKENIPYSFTFLRLKRGIDDIFIRTLAHTPLSLHVSVYRPSPHVRNNTNDLLFPNPHLSIYMYMRVHVSRYRLHGALTLGKSGDSISPRLLSFQRNYKKKETDDEREKWGDVAARFALISS